MVLLGMGALFVASVILYLPAAKFDFLNWDDLAYVVDNDNVKGGITWTGISWTFTAFHSSNWHPLTWISHMLDCQVFGLNPAGHHMTNVGLHALNSALLLYVLVQLTACGNFSPAAEVKKLKSPPFWGSLFIAGTFAVHPLRVESVAWVSERKDLLSALFFLLTLWAYAKYVNRSRDNAAPAARRFYLFSLGFFTLGLMSKPMLVTLPFVLLLLDLWPLRRWDFHELKMLKALLWEKVPFFGLTIASSVITFLAQKSGGAVATVEMLPFPVRLQNAAISYVQYVLNFFWPSGLSPLYRHRMHIEWWITCVALLALGIVTLIAWRARKGHPWLMVGWLWFIGMLVPVIGLVQVGSQALADRYMYLPAIGLSIAVIWEIGQRLIATPLPRPAIALAALVALSALAWTTSRQIQYWRNTRTLFSRVLALDPNNVQALYAVGTDVVEKGDTQAGRRFLERAIELNPSYPEALGGMASLSEMEGNYKEAVAYYEAVLKAQPSHDAALNNLAWLLASCPEPQFRDGQQAIHLATRACELTRYSRPVYIGTLAAAYAEAGDFERAVATAERAAKLAENLNLPDIAARNRELIEFYKQGRAAHET